MKIPAITEEGGVTHRHNFYADIAQKCSVSRRERHDFYKILRNYYLFGTADAMGCAYNKIASTIETRWSFMYTPAGVKFAINLGPSVDKNETFKIPPLVHEVNDQWRMGKTHLNFDICGKWAHVFGCMIFKVLWDEGVARSYPVEPHMFGVLREDVPDLADQEAFVEYYSMTKTQLESELADHPHRDRIMEQIRQAGTTQGDGENDFDSGLSRLILATTVATSPTTAVGGSVDGGIPNALTSYDYAPQVEAEMVDMMELYIWNDDINDYQMVTMASPNIVIYDRKQTGVPGIPCYVKLAPEANLYDYFWGASYVAKLTKLQDWRNERMDQIKNILSIQANPPMAFSGYTGISDEKFAAFWSAGGMVSSPIPGAKAESLAPTMPANIFAEIDMIDKMFDDAAGIGHILQGKGEPGVRSKGQADLMARLGSARPKSAAVIVEEAAEDVATLILRSVQENSKQRFVVDMADKRPTGFWKKIFGKNNQGTQDEGTQLIFTADQFTNDYEVKVDAHSSSPIFFEDRKQDAITLFENKAISRSRLIEAFDPSDKQILLEELKEIEAKEAQAQQMAAQQQQKPQGQAK